jgi:hypothetical protein
MRGQPRPLEDTFYIRTPYITLLYGVRVLHTHPFRTSIFHELGMLNTIPGTAVVTFLQIPGIHAESVNTTTSKHTAKLSVLINQTKIRSGVMANMGWRYDCLAWGELTVCRSRCLEVGDKSTYTMIWNTLYSLLRTYRELL